MSESESGMSTDELVASYRQDLEFAIKEKRSKRLKREY
jgi:hypothetical protein